jgi:peptidyl-prolyl cis-trans isomerase B (cyclophilin B)
MRKIFLLAVFFGIFLGCQNEKVYYIEIETDFGTMKAELYNSTPLHRDNILKLADEGFYDDLLFHRVMRDFMVQGGDPESKDADPSKRLGAGGPGYTIPAEIGAPHFKGTLAGARQGDGVNPERKSSGSQFYIVQGQKQTDAQLDQFEKSGNFKYNESQRKKYKEIGGTPFLDNQYTVFGELVSGLDVVDKIAAVQTAPGDRPIEDVKMKVRVVK